MRHSAKQDLTRYYSTTYSSPVGLLTLGSDGKHLIGLWINQQKYYGATVPKNMVENSDLPLFDSTKDWIDRYFAGKAPLPTELPLAPIGGDFRQGVWELLCNIPYGKVTTYGEIATQMAVRMNKRKMASQAVGGAVGHNPISIVIPCHRVVGAKGNLTGYASGIPIKIKLLELEGVDMSGMFAPAKK